MSTEIKTKESTEVESLEDYMSKSGHNLTQYEDSEFSVLFENDNETKNFGDNSESSSFDIEKEFFGDIESAKDILNETSGIPGKVEPDVAVEDVSDASVESDGVVSGFDYDGVMAALKRINGGIEEMNTDLDIINKIGVSDPKIADEMIFIREKLSEDELNYVRKIFPELYPLVNEGDIEIIDNIQEKLNSVKKGKGLKDKLRILISNKEITQEEERAFFEALKRKDNFVDEAKKRKLSPKIANSIYRVGKSLSEELAASSEEDLEMDIVSDKKIEDTEVDSEKTHVSENVNDEYLIIKNSLLDDCRIYREELESVKNEDAKITMRNAIANFEKSINQAFDSDIEIDQYVVDNLNDYSLGIRKNIDESLLLKPVHTEEEINSPEVLEEEKTEFSEKLSENVEKELQKLAECRRIAHQIKNIDLQNEVFVILKESESEIRYELSKNLPDTDKTVIINRIARKYYEKYDEIIKKYNTSPSDDEKVLDISNELEGETEKVGEKKKINSKIIESFETVGVTIDALKEIEGFDRLSGAKQYLVFKNFQSVIWDKVHIDSKKEADREWKKDSTIGKLGRFGLSVITLGSARTYREKLKQKEIFNSLTKTEALSFENRKSILESLVEVANETPEVTLDSDNNIHVEYIEKNKFKNNPYSSEIISDFNAAASEYASLPYSWFDDNNPFDTESDKEVSYTTKLLGKKNGFITGKEKARLAELRDNYNQAKEEYLKLYLEENGDSPEVKREALKELNSLDEKIRMNQLFNSDPRAESLLQNIDDTSVFNQAMSEYAAKRGVFMAYGSLIKIAAMLPVSAIAAPVAVAVFSRNGYARGKRDVRDLLKMKRESGILSDETLKESVVYTVDLEKSLSDLKKARLIAQGSGNAMELHHLNTRIDEVEGKINSGHKIERKTRLLGEFRDAKFFTDRIDNLVEKYELLNNTSGQEAEAKIIEHKIAQTSALMRELLNNNLLSFGYSSEGDVKSKDAKRLLNKLSFVQALAKADTVVAVDDEAIKKKVAEIVKIRREKINDIDNAKSIKHIKQSIKNSILFGGVGYAIAHLASEFFSLHNPFEHHDFIYETKQGDSINELLSHNIKALSKLDVNAKNNAITNFLNHLSNEQLKQVGISNPHNLLPGQKINIDKLKELFETTRVNGKTVIENAEYVTRTKGGGGLSMKEMMRLKDDSNKNNYEPDQEEVAPVYRNSNVDPNKPLITHEDIKRDIADKDFETSEESKYEINGVTKPRPAIDSDLNIKQIEDIGIAEENWDHLNIQEKLSALDTMIPEYIKKMLGENMDTFNTYSKNMPSSSLLINNASFSHAKIDMLKDLRQELFDRGITPEKGFKYLEGQTLYDYVSHTFRARIITDGPLAVK